MRVEEGRIGDAVGAVERLYEEHSARLWRSLVLFSGDREIASDAVSEAFVQLLGRGSAVRDPARWIWRAGFRIAAGLLKERGGSTPMIVEPERAYEVPDPLPAIVEGLRRLSPKQRSSVVLHHYAGYPLADVARIIGSTTAAVGVHLHRGRNRLRQLLEDDDA